MQTNNNPNAERQTCFRKTGLFPEDRPDTGRSDTMTDDELELAKTALRVLPENGPLEFEKWYLTSGARDEQQVSQQATHPFAIVNYDLTSSTPIEFPEAYQHFTDIVVEHLRTSSNSGPWGVLQSDVIVLRVSDQPASNSGRVILLQAGHFSVLLKRLFPKVNITNSERHTLLQILIGHSLKQAAEQDNVSYETKKTQMSSVYRKTHIRRQQELSSFLTAHITLEVAAQFSRAEKKAEPDTEFFHYVDTYLGNYVRASVIQESADSRFRVIEIGDPTGKPVVCVHHLGILGFSAHELELIRKLGIRLICPLRHGAIGPRDKKISHDDFLQHAVAGIDLAVSLTGERKATIITMLSGCFYALKYIEAHSHRVANLIFLGAPYKPVNQTVSRSSFKRKLHRLAFTNDATLNTTITFMMKRVEKTDQLRKVWETSLNHGEADMRAVAEVCDDPLQLNALQYRLVHSASSVAQDLRTQVKGSWNPLEKIAGNTGIHFIHGSDDDLIPIEGIRSLVASDRGYQLHAISNAGNWIFGSHSERTYSVISSIVAGNDQSTRTTDINDSLMSSRTH